MAPERPSYGLTKSSATLLVQQIAKDTKVQDMQIVSFHPGGVLTDMARNAGYDENSGIPFDHGRFRNVWSILEIILTFFFLQQRIFLVILLSGLPVKRLSICMVGLCGLVGMLMRCKLPLGRKSQDPGIFSGLELKDCLSRDLTHCMRRL